MHVIDQRRLAHCGAKGPQEGSTCRCQGWKKNLFSRLETKNLTFPDGGPQNISRKKRRDDVIKNLMKAGVLDPTTSIPYLEKMFNPGGSYLEIANEKDLEPFNVEESRPQSTSDYQSDDNDSVD